MQEQQLNLKQEQKQIVTPAQLQSLTMLTLATQELNTFISEQLLENPVLELADAEAKEDDQLTTAEFAELEDDGWKEPETAQIAYEDWGYGSSGGALLRESPAKQGQPGPAIIIAGGFFACPGGNGAGGQRHYPGLG